MKKRTSALVLSILTMLIIPPALSAKGDTVKITIKGAGLTTPIEITERKIRDFRVWAGPGVGVNGIEQTDGFVIDWSQGTVAKRPSGLQHYEVSFYTKLSKEGLVFVVSYEYDPSSKRGYVYLPGKGDEWYRLNTSTMFHGHGLEGNWFRATSAWENFVRPLIARARAADAHRSNTGPVSSSGWRSESEFLLADARFPPRTRRVLVGWGR